MDIFLGTIFLIICCLLVVVVLLQKGRGVGLGGAFGGGGSSAFGTRTGDVFTWVTIVLVSIFLLLTVAATLRFRPPTETVSTPGFDPRPGPIAEPTLVSMGSRTPKADVYFTLDGSDPTTGSAKYEGPVQVAPGKTLRARAYYKGWHDSEVGTGAYPYPAPAFDPPQEPLAAPTAVAISYNVPGVTNAIIRYTINGEKPTAASLRYEAPVTVTPGTVLKAVAFIPGVDMPSEEATARYDPPTASQPASGLAPIPATGRIAPPASATVPSH